MFGDRCGAFTCPSSQALRGDDCFTPVACSSTLEGYTATAGICNPTPLPWQPAGQVRTGAVVSTTGAIPTQAPLYTFTTLVYGPARHTLAHGASTWALPGQVCSADSTTLNARTYVILIFCGQPFLSFLDTTQSTPHILSGKSTWGYREGYRDEALYERELYIAKSPSHPNKFYISDRLNCKLRMVVIENNPGDYTTRSYWLYGSTQTGFNSLQTRFKRALTPFQTRISNTL